MTKFKTEQEQFWAESFGDEYSARNVGDKWVANNTALFAKVLAHTKTVNSVIEFGANIGLNLHAIRRLLPSVALSAVEINNKAVEELKLIDDIEVYAQSILDFVPNTQYDFVLIKGVLIHINPDNIAQLYDLLHKSSKCYICVAEYYNPSPVEVTYRGHKNKLFKRDFAGEMLDRFDDLRLVDYGFVYHRDLFPQDDTTWFLLEKLQ
jgi:pseudaminic acid biosynthesis-associated methylase